MAAFASRIWQLAYHLPAHESLAKSGVLNAVFAQLQHNKIINIKIEHISLDSTRIKVHPDGTGALENSDHNPSDNHAAAETPRFIWLPQMIGPR